MEKVKEKDRTYQMGVERGMFLGVKYGNKRGFEFGITKTKMEIAKRMLEDQCSYDDIVKYVELNEEEIKKLVI